MGPAPPGAAPSGGMNIAASRVNAHPFRTMAVGNRCQYDSLDRRGHNSVRL